MKLSDYTSLDGEFLDRCREGVSKLDSFLKTYVDLQDLDTVSQISSLERLKREHSAYMSYFIRFYTKASMYRENGEFLASERKSLKSSCINELVAQGRTQTTADKIVYSTETYQKGIKDIQDIRNFLIHVYETYDLHKNTISRNIYQSISTLQKEVENLK